MPSAALHTDIASSGWIARLPPKARAYAQLMRLDRPVGIWLLFLPGLCGILLPAGLSWRQRAVLAALFAIGSVVMRGAGCVVNDMWDRDIDAQVARTAGRPLASGRLRMREAATLLAVLLALGLAVLLMLNPLCWALGVFSLFLVGLYPLAKRVTWWPQLVMGFTFGFGAPMGYAASAGRIDAAALALYAATITWQLGYDTIYGFQDMEDDALIGVKSTSRLFAHAPRRFVGACYAAAIAAFALAGWCAGLGIWFWLTLLLPTAGLALQAALVDPRNAPLCLRLFRSNREVGLLLALAIGLGRV